MIDITLPADQSEGTTNVVGKWFKAVQDRVAANDPLLEITTDKVTVEIAAPADGVLVEILKQEGEEIEMGEVLGRMETGGRADGQTGGDRVMASGAAAKQSPVRPGEVASGPAAPRNDGGGELSPAVRRLLKEHGLDPAAISGTGSGGRITVEDVERHVASLSASPPLRPSARRAPHSPMRRAIADHMVRSMATAPHVTSVFEADLGAVMAHREAHRAAFEARGVKLTYTSYFLRATAEAIKAVPEANSRWHDDGLEIFDEVHLGIATALGSGGLIVPVLRNAQTLDLEATARGVQDLAERARAGTLSPQDVQGGTFSISNHGVSGSLLATPIIINQPQSAILGVGKLAQRPVVRGGQIVARPMLYVTLTIDHRVLDGFSANAFLRRWVETIEGWSQEGA
jgi:2-oxoglutarate dehydrogenase E2 component (dihydrolipoamide succinyltransferase)